MKNRNIVVRKVSASDFNDVLVLSNQEDVRFWSFSSKLITESEHREYFKNVLLDKNEFIYVVTTDSIFMGQVRFSIVGKSAVVGISLKSNFQGFGLGYHFLKESMQKFSSEKKINKFIAYIKPDNIGSIKLFKKVGFNEIANSNDKITLLLEKEYNKMSNFHLRKREGTSYIIAEMSANHGHDINIAKKTIKAAKDSGADAIKLQTYTPDTITLKSDKEWFKLKHGTIWDGMTLYDLYSEAYTPWEWHKELSEYAKMLDIDFFSSPFDKTAVDLLESLNVPLYKIASFEIVDIPLIEYVASKGKPIIISTGISSLGDIEEAISACKKYNNNQIILLKCTSEYPAKLEDANLLTIPNMKDTFGVEVGLSDHTMGSLAPIVAVSLGAKVIEKHFILKKSIGGPDSSFSMEPEEFSRMVEDIRKAEKTLGKIDYSMSDKKKNNKIVARSLFVVEDISEGELFTEENVRSIRPGYGIAPKYLPKVLGKKALRSIEAGTPLNFSMFEL